MEFAAQGELREMGRTHLPGSAMMGRADSKRYTIPPAKG